MSRWLNLGAGRAPCLLEPPWENFDLDVDIQRPLPFDSHAARFIHAEHLIEHVPFLSGVRFLRECWRVLEPGGVLRLAFPDVSRFIPEYGALPDTRDSKERRFRVEAYCEHLAARGLPADGLRDVVEFIMLGSGHQSTWTESIAVGALSVAGFSRVSVWPLTHSSLQVLGDADRHQLTSSVATIETTVLEATK